MVKLRSGAPFDLIEDLVIPLPVSIIAEMLGVETARQSDSVAMWMTVSDRRLKDPAAAIPSPRALRTQ
jgi:hypothetical protein